MAGPGDTFGVLPRPARGYLLAVHAAAVAAVALSTGVGRAVDWVLIIVVAALCVAGKALESFAPGHYALQPGYAALIWGCLLLPAWIAPILALACFALDLRTERARALQDALQHLQLHARRRARRARVVTGRLGSDLYRRRRGGGRQSRADRGRDRTGGEQPLRGTLHQITDGLPLSIGVGLTGAVCAELWVADPILLVLAVGPIGLLYRALWVPMLQHRADTDAKTGLFHSERIREEVAAQISAAGSDGRLAVAMLDLDYLRTINSRCGHLAGDRAIRAVADELAVLAATHGAAGRFGGEEFCLVLPDFDGRMVEVQLEAILKRLRRIEFREAPDVRISFSAGVAVHPEHGTTVDTLLSAADTALYDAKAAGRSRVRVALAPTTREALVASVTDPVLPEQPLPAASVGGSRVAAALAGFNRRTSDTPSSRVERDLGDAHAALARMQGAYLDMLLALAGALEDKDPYMEGAGARVAAIATRLADELSCSETEQQSIALAAALRDIGRAGVRDAVLHKNEALDPLEREEIRSQAELATRVLADLELPVSVKQTVRSHHERWDGTGYPDRLAGEEIPLGARILAVAEALDAMLSSRPHRPALPLERALGELAGGAGSQFCPTVAAAARRCFASGLGTQNERRRTSSVQSARGQCPGRRYCVHDGGGHLGGSASTSRQGNRRTIHAWRRWT